MRFSILPLLAALTVLAAASSGQTPADRDEKKITAQSSGTIIGGKTLYQWIQEVKDPDPSVKENAIATIKLYGSTGRVAASAIIPMLEQRDVSLKVNAAITLGIIGMEEKDLSRGVNGLIRKLGDSEAIVRFQAATALGRLGSDGRAAIPNLITTLRDGSSWEIRKAAAEALGMVSFDRQTGPDLRSIRALAKVLDDSCAQVRLSAILALIVLGPPATGADKTAAIHALQGCFKDRDKVVMIWARMGQMRMDGNITEAHLTAIAKYLKGNELSPRTHASRALGTIGPEAKSRVPDLMAALDDNEPLVLTWSAWALGQIGPPAAKALPRLESLKGHKDEGIRQTALEAIERIETKTR